MKLNNVTGTFGDVSSRSPKGKRPRSMQVGAALLMRLLLADSNAGHQSFSRRSLHRSDECCIHNRPDRRHKDSLERRFKCHCRSWYKIPVAPASMCSADLAD